MKIKLLAVILAALTVTAAASACSKNEVPETLPATEPETPAEVTEIATEAPTEEPTEPQGDYNYLTGLYDLEAGAPTRPIAFMVGNNPPSRPQYGIDKADMYVETETEGGITRIMAVFSSINEVPEQIGPIRSGRTPFINLANALDVVYVHCGASIEGFAAIDRTGIAEIDAITNPHFWRDSYLREAKGYEYSLMTSQEMLRDDVLGGAFNTEHINEAPFKFEEQRSSVLDATKIELEPSYFETISFTYDVENNCYYKQLGSLDNAERHLTADGEPIIAENVIAIYDEQYWENDVTINYNLNVGSAKLFTGGTVRDITWSRDTKQLSFYETDGTAAKLNPGRTYIVIASHQHEGAMKYY